MNENQLYEQFKFEMEHGYRFETVMEIVRWYGSIDHFEEMAKKNAPFPSTTVIQVLLADMMRKNITITPEVTQYLEEQITKTGIVDCIGRGILAGDEQIDAALTQYNLKEFTQDKRKSR